MSDVDTMRVRATRLFALALQAHEHGFSSAGALTRMASQALAKAEAMERRAIPLPPASGMPSAVVEPKRQPQPKQN
jgi:hypothetical protein